ncbi:MAG: hypothetical protein JWN61_1057, partial [Pseudonocardiales bacterium]|nr:hypothetical protein [Pseudonocardiales bacterium]
MESAFGGTFGDVRIHDDSESASLSRTMSARAFTTGSDVFFGAGEYQPDTPGGERMLAHELAHTRQSGGVHRQLIHRKLRGTASALADQGGAENSGRARKLVGKLTNWDRIIKGVEAYEAMEAGLLATGTNPSPMELAKIKPSMLRQLTRVQGDIAKWQSSNDEEGAQETSDQWHRDANVVDTQGKPPPGEKAKKSKKAKADTRAKSPRRQAVAMLIPRIGNEIALLSNPDPAAWTSSLGLNTNKVETKGEDASGQKNTVSELTYKLENNQNFTGYFKKDTGFNATPERQELKTGIRQADPNYGARTVAMYRIDQLLGAGVTARAEFAVHQDGAGKSVLGTVLEKAKGVSGGDVKTGMDTAQAASLGPDAVSMDDPALQRGLNKLQLLDVVCGQLDRHPGNYYIEADGKGGAKSVTGIDLDMAFGADMNVHDDIAAEDAFNYKGIPDLIDAEMGTRILQLQASDIRAALTGLLNKPEIDATVNRFLSVQRKVQEVSDAGALTSQWGKATASQGRKTANAVQFGSNRESYVDDVAFGTFIATKGQILELLKAFVAGDPDQPALIESARLSDWESLHGETRSEMIRRCLYGGNGLTGAAGAMASFIYDRQVPGEQIPSMVALFINEMMNPRLLNRAEVRLQENPDGHGGETADDVNALLTKALPLLAKRAKLLNRGGRRNGVRLGKGGAQK